MLMCTLSLIADDEMVWLGKVRALDKVGNDLADRVLILAGGEFRCSIMDSRRQCGTACANKYLVVL